MPDTVLSTRGLSKDFGPVRVLFEVDFDLEQAEVHAVIGENGAGKSTLMKILGGYLPPSEGSISLFGEKVSFNNSTEAEALGVVLIHQEFNLADDLTVEENIFLGRELHSGPFTDAKTMIERSRALLDDLKTPVDPRRKVRDLSVSQKQMVEIAKAVSRDARILIMDEPTDVLTGTETQVLFELIGRLKESGVTVVYISHKLDEVKAVADRVTVLRDGHVVAVKPVDEVSTDELASLMVGRELSDMYPQKNKVTEQVVFAAKSVTVPGWVQDASFELRRGEILGFAGLVGAGRTELMEGLLGLRSRIGTIYRNGQEVAMRSPGDAVSLGIAYLSEDRKGKGIITEMRLRPNLTLLALERYAKPFIDVSAEEKALQNAVDTFEIKVPSLRARASDLSGGNQQKVVLAKIMEIQPDIIILDEPTRGIDVGTKRQIYFFISELAEQGKSCILVSSEMQELIGLCHRVVVMRSGHIAGTLQEDELKEDEIVRYATGLKGDGLKGDGQGEYAAST